MCFAGWAWVHYYWDSPLGGLLWQDGTYRLAAWLGVDWEAFVGSGANDGLIQRWLPRLAWLFLAGAVLALVTRRSDSASPAQTSLAQTSPAQTSPAQASKTRRWIARGQMAGLLLGCGLLVLLSYAKYVAAQRQTPMFVEHGGQMLSPAVLVLAIWLGPRHRATVSLAIAAVVMTFAGHGVYALGVWPTPGSFFAMTSVILEVEYPTAKLMLRAAGGVDLAICAGLLLPYVRVVAAGYAALWGLLTALARPVAGMSWELNYWGADQYVHEAVLRAPHYLLPLYLMLLWCRPRS